MQTDSPTHSSTFNLNSKKSTRACRWQSTNWCLHSMRWTWLNYYQLLTELQPYPWFHDCLSRYLAQTAASPYKKYTEYSLKIDINSTSIWTPLSLLTNCCSKCRYCVDTWSRDTTSWYVAQPIQARLLPWDWLPWSSTTRSRKDPYHSTIPKTTR